MTDISQGGQGQDQMWTLGGMKMLMVFSKSQWSVKRNEKEGGTHES